MADRQFALLSIAGKAVSGLVSKFRDTLSQLFLLIKVVGTPEGRRRIEKRGLRPPGRNNLHAFLAHRLVK